MSNLLLKVCIHIIYFNIFIHTQGVLKFAIVDFDPDVFQITGFDTANISEGSSTETNDEFRVWLWQLPVQVVIVSFI